MRLNANWVSHKDIPMPKDRKIIISYRDTVFDAMYCNPDNMSGLGEGYWQQSTGVFMLNKARCEDHNEEIFGWSFSL